MDNFLGLFNHGSLILAYRDGGGIKSRDVRRLADRIGKKAYRYACFKVAHLDFRFHRGVSLQPGDRNQVHIVERKLTQFRNLGLDKQRGLFRIQPACQIVKRYLYDILTHLFRIIRIISECLGICNHNKYFIVFSGVLQLHPAFQGTHIMAHVKPSGRAVARQDNFTHNQSPVA